MRSLFRRNAGTEAANRLYGAVVERARTPGFYETLGVPDTATGRFAMIALHGALVMRRLSTDRDARDFTEAFLGIMFADLDRNLREMGVGDLSVGKKVKGLARHFYGMAAALDGGLKSGGSVLGEVVTRNIYGGTAPAAEAVSAMSEYIRACVSHLADYPLQSLLEGTVDFAPVPVEVAHAGNRDS